MENTKSVTQDSPPAVQENASPEVQETVNEETISQSSKVPKGYVPYQSLDEERSRRKGLERQLAEQEQEIADLKTSLAPEEEDPKLAELSRQLQEFKEERELEKAIAENPKLKEFESDLREFRKEHPRAKWSSVAKLFLVEKGLLDSPRQGLETTTGGGKEPPKTKFTAEEAAELRQNNYREYKARLLAGELKDL